MPPGTIDSPVETAEVDATTALLIRARGFVERGWTRSAEARAASGVAVYATSAAAVSWCAWGALIAAGLSNGPTSIRHPAYLRLRTAMGGIRIVEFNDAQESVEPVIVAFDRAIAMGSW